MARMIGLGLELELGPGLRLWSGSAGSRSGLSGLSGSGSGSTTGTTHQQRHAPVGVGGVLALHDVSDGAGVHGEVGHGLSHAERIVPV